MLGDEAYILNPSATKATIRMVIFSGHYFNDVLTNPDSQNAKKYIKYKNFNKNSILLHSTSGSLLLKDVTQIANFHEIPLEESNKLEFVAPRLMADFESQVIVIVYIKTA